MTALPQDVSDYAIFLDVDGTLLDIADDPDSVVIEPWMPGALRRISARVGGALALISGRSLFSIDRLFAGARLAAIGLHGTEWRDASGAVRGAGTTPEFELAKAEARHWASAGPGLIFEDKGTAFALHYRRVPEREPGVRAFMEDLRRSVGEGWVTQEGKCVVELRPGGRDKGDALLSFMERKPFAGRRPLAIGDDITDEPMFAAANSADGLTVRVGADAKPTLASHRIAAPADVRAWLERIAT